jgi:hypothetical protein
MKMVMEHPEKATENAIDEVEFNRLLARIYTYILSLPGYDPITTAGSENLGEESDPAGENETQEKDFIDE